MRVETHRSSFFFSVESSPPYSPWLPNAGLIVAEWNESKMANSPMRLRLVGRTRQTKDKKGEPSSWASIFRARAMTPWIFFLPGDKGWTIGGWWWRESILRGETAALLVFFSRWAFMQWLLTDTWTEPFTDFDCSGMVIVGALRWINNSYNQLRTRCFVGLANSS